MIDTNATTPAESGEAAAPKPSPWASLFGVFTGPGRVFAAYAPRPAFLVPLLVVIVVHLGLGAWVTSTGIPREAAIAQLEAKNAPADQIEATERVMDSPPVKVFGVVMGGIMTGFAVLLAAALLYFAANLMMGAKLTFRHYMCAASFGSVVGLVDSVVRTSLMVSRGDVHVRMGLGSFLGDATGFPVAALDALTGPLLLWSVAVQAIGVGVFAKKGFGFGALASVPGLLLMAVFAGING